ncbi:hypothetical protein ERJ75_000328600 [Trypanosoma vivax]|nr:hypothetical protein ERJ75_000328600 [Trypanosoma vivax]
MSALREDSPLAQVPCDDGMFTYTDRDTSRATTDSVDGSSTVSSREGNRLVNGLRLEVEFRDERIKELETAYEQLLRKSRFEEGQLRCQLQRAKDELGSIHGALPAQPEGRGHGADAGAGAEAAEAAASGSAWEKQVGSAMCSSDICGGQGAEANRIAEVLKVLETERKKAAEAERAAEKAQARVTELQKALGKKKAAKLQQPTELTREDARQEADLRSSKKDAALRASGRVWQRVVRRPTSGSAASDEPFPLLGGEARGGPPRYAACPSCAVM